MSRRKLLLERARALCFTISLTLLATFAGIVALRADKPSESKSSAEQSTESPAAIIVQDPSVDLGLSELSPAELQQVQADLQADKPVKLKGFDEPVTGKDLVMLEMAGDPRWPGSSQLVDVTGEPIVAPAGKLSAARVTFLCRDTCCFESPVYSLANSKGQFAAQAPPDGLGLGRMSPLLIKLPGGHSFESSYIIVQQGIAIVRVPTHLHPKAPAPQDVKPNDVGGLVVDEDGNPLEGVEVAIYEGMMPGTTSKTGRDGVFHILSTEPDYEQHAKVVLIRFRKDGYSPVRFARQPVGINGWVVALDSKTLFEGTVRGTDGQPVAGASIRANQGPKQNENGIIPDLWTETKTDEAGHYELYVQPDEYEFLVTAGAKGVARLSKMPICHGHREKRDIQLQQGVEFVANIVDAQTNEPVPGVRLWHWQHPGVEGRSDEKGRVTISGLTPGDFSFWVEADDYVRWWSEECKNEYARKSIDNPKLHWQRNFDELGFDMQQGMKPVTIVVEKAVRIRGRVVDPEGQPVAGATVAPALTGSGNSLTGDTRFSVETAADGTFDMKLPASHEARYNLIAHDGKYQQWRKWANGVGEPFQTKPGQEIDGVELKLTRPSTIHGRIVDDKGEKVANVKVAADAVNALDNRYYVPSPVETDAEGRFEIHNLRPAEYLIREVETGLVGGNRIQLAEGQGVHDVEVHMVGQ
jgi:hypothetical protein